MSSIKLAELKNRITFIRESRNLSKVTFADRLGISGAYVTDLESGKNKNISRTLSKLIFYEFGFNPEWTRTGKGEMFIDREKEMPDIVSEKIMLVIKDMDEDSKREILKRAEEKKLLLELLAEKKKGKKAG